MGRLAGMAEPLFVDCHSHVVPSGDDGAASVHEGIELCRSAAAHGTRVLFATPHVWPHLGPDERREAAIRRAFDAVAARAPLELRLGYELTPTRALLEVDPHRYLLEGTDAVLMEVPFTGSARALFALAEHVEAAGLRPVIAHPERTEAVLAEPELAVELNERGWVLQVNATSLLGRHGEAAEELAWSLVEDDRVAIVASDGHRVTRPAHVDGAYDAVARRMGGEAALPLFDGTALGLAPVHEAATRRAS
jgi:protein-tyrosine phosphatase